MPRKLILLVEDTPDDEALALRALSKSSIDADVVVARGGEEALNFLFASGPHAVRDPGRLPDVVISDLKLNNIDGVELLKRIRSDTRTQVVPVVILSSSAQDDDRRRAYFHGANGYVRKPVNAEGFREVVRQLASYWLALNEPAPAVGADGSNHVGLSRELRDGERSLRFQIEGMNDFAVFMLDCDGSVATWNAGAERFKGYRAEEILGKHFSCFYTGEDVAARKPQRELSIAERDGRFEDEGWRVRQDGTKFWANVVITALSNSQGQLVGFGKVTRDITERRKANEQFRLAIEAAPTGMLMMDRTGKIVLVNEQVERLFGYPREELLGQRIEMLVPERFRARHPEFRKTFFGDPRARAMGGGRELYGLRKDGTEVPVEIGLNPLQTSDGDFVLSSVVDITERKGAEREREDLLGQLRTLNAELEERVRDRTSELSATLKEREVLLQEIHHRVKNNLQVISSLINMQVRQLEDTSSRDALEECQTRVQAIALIHEKLYQSKNYSRVPFSEYAKSLAENVFSASGVSVPSIVLDLQMEDVALAVDKAIPCGLILNELITNALKHAFPQGRQGRVRVELRRVGDHEMVLSVGDDGIGMSADFDPAKSNSLGVQLVLTLVEQLDGHLEIVRQNGTMFRVKFPLEAA